MGVSTPKFPGGTAGQVGQLSDLEVDSSTVVVDETNDRLGIGTIVPRTRLTVEGAVTLKEQAAADADTAAYGQLWVKTATPNELYFTTDAGDDIQITSGTATAFVGDITGVTAGTLLDGGGATGAVTLNVDLTEAGAATIAAGDYVLFLDGGTSGSHAKGSINDVATLFAGTASSTGLSASSGVLSVSDLHPVGVDGSANQLITDDGDGTVTSESGLTYDGSTLALTGDITVSGGDISYGNGQAATLSVATTSSGTDGRDLTVSAGSAPTGSANQSGGDLLLKSGGGDGTGTSMMAFYTKINGVDAAAERMRIHTDGNVGIGDNAPGTLLQVSGADAYLTLKNTTAENSDGGAETKIIFEDHANASLGQIEVSHAGSSDDTKGKMVLSTHTGSSLTAALTINESQQVTIGDGKLVLNATAVEATAAEINAACDASGRTAAAVDVGADHFLFCDGGATGATKVESLTDLITAVAGTAASTGLSASSGVLTVSDLHPVGVSGAANQLLTDDGDGTVTSEGNLSFDGSTLTVTGDVTVGGGDLLFGNGQNAKTTVAAVAGTDTAGKNLTIECGQGTGTGAGGQFVVKVAPAAGGSGSGVNSRATAFTIDSSKNVNLQGHLEVGNDGKKIKFGDDSDVSLQHVHDTGLLLNSSRQLQFGDSGTYINQTGDGILGINSDSSIDINANTVGLGVSGNTTAVTFKVPDNTGTNVGKNLEISAGSTNTGSNNLNGGNLVLSSGGGDGTGTSAIQFKTKISGTDAVTEKARITGDGYFIIGDGGVGSAQTAAKKTFTTTGISDNTGTDLWKIVIPNANHNAAIRYTMILCIEGGKNTKVKENFIAISRQSGSNTLYTLGPDPGGQIDLNSTSSNDYSSNNTVLSALTGASGAEQSFLVNCTPNSSDNSDTHAIMCHVEVYNLSGTGIYVTNA